MIREIVKGCNEFDNFLADPTIMHSTQEISISCISISFPYNDKGVRSGIFSLKTQTSENEV